MALRARTFTYAVSVDSVWTAASDKGGAPIPLDDAWTPEHLVLAGLARCTLQSLDYHAKLRALELTSSAAARGTVTKRETDERYAFVDIAVDLDIALAPTPQDLHELLAKAERDCFVGASLTVAPDYRWTVNGQEIV